MNIIDAITGLWNPVTGFNATVRRDRDGHTLHIQTSPYTTQNKWLVHGFYIPKRGVQIMALCGDVKDPSIRRTFIREHGRKIDKTVPEYLAEFELVRFK